MSGIYLKIKDFANLEILQWCLTEWQRGPRVLQPSTCTWVTQRITGLESQYEDPGNAHVYTRGEGRVDSPHCVLKHHTQLEMHGTFVSLTAKHDHHLLSMQDQSSWHDNKKN